MNRDPSQILSLFAERIVRTILDTLGDENIDSIFLSGSVARDRIAAFVSDGTTEIYSDLDVYVMVPDGTDLGASRRRVREAVQNLPREGEHYRIFPKPDVGVFTKSDFLNQKTRPGTVEIDDGHIVLHGGGEPIEWAGKFAAAAIEPLEGLYLLENRLCEIADLTDRLHGGRSDGLCRYVQYVLMKSCMDAAASVLIVFGRFAPARDERIRRFRERSFLEQSHALLPAGSVDLIDRCATDLSNLQQSLRMSPVEFEFEELRREVESILLDVWKRIAERLESRHPMSWDEAVSWRCKKGRRYRNFRELFALAKGMSIPRLRLLPRAGRLTRLSPVDALRLHGAVDILLRRGDILFAGEEISREALKDGYLGPLDGLTRVFDIEGGTLYERSRRMFRETT